MLLMCSTRNKPQTASWAVMNHQSESSHQIRLEAVRLSAIFLCTMHQMASVWSMGTTFEAQTRSNLDCIHAFCRYFHPKRLTFTFYQFKHSLGIEPMRLAFLVQCGNVWATGMLYSTDWTLMIILVHLHKELLC